jgi:hypothetical protein
MPGEQPTIDDASAADTAVQAAAAPAYEPAEDEWLQEPELPPRPRRRLLGEGGTASLRLALLAVLLVACGFIGGALVEKGQASSNSSNGAAGGIAARLAALRGGASSATRSGTSSTGGGFGGLPGSGAGGTRPIAGQVAYLAGSTLYVTNTEGNTVKVTTSAGTSVTKTVSATVKGIHPGETVTVTGATGANGAVSAESIRVGSTGGGLAALFGGAGAAGGSGSATGASGRTGGGVSLFGG